jgi:group I intron endonuclease
MSDRVSGVYAIENRVTREYYIGSSVNIRQRRQGHRYDLRRGRHGNPRLQESWSLHGENAFMFLTLADMPLAAARVAEGRMLARLLADPRCLNISPSEKGGMHGRRHREETVARLRADKTGRRASSETRAKMSAAHLGRVIPCDVVEKRRASFAANKANHKSRFGRKLSAETIAKRQASRRANAEARAKSLQP